MPFRSTRKHWRRTAHLYEFWMAWPKELVESPSSASHRDRLAQELWCTEAADGRARTKGLFSGWILPAKRSHSQRNRANTRGQNLPPGETA